MINSGLERKDMAIYACNLYLLSLKHETGVFFTFIYSHINVKASISDSEILCSQTHPEKSGIIDVRRTENRVDKYLLLNMLQITLAHPKTLTPY